jgi:hypothetical protein
MDVLKLLHSKNRCLERFLELSLGFLKSTDQQDFVLSDELVSFQSRRDATLKAMDLYDRKLTEAIGQLPPQQRTPALVQSVKAELTRKETLVLQILDIDLKIMGHIESEKNRILKDMASTRKSKDMLSKFKSTWVAELGEELDTKL